MENQKLIKIGKYILEFLIVGVVYYIVKHVF